MGLSEFQSPSQKPGSAACTTLPGLGRLKSASTGEKIVFLNNLTTEVGGFRYSRGFSPRGCPRFAVTPTTKSLLTQPLYGKGRNPPPSEPPELALGDAFSGLNDYDTGVTPGCCSGWNGLTDPFRGVFDFQYRRTTGSDKQLHRGRSSVRHHLHPVARGAPKVRA